MKLLVRGMLVVGACLALALAGVYALMATGDAASSRDRERFASLRRAPAASASPPASASAAPEASAIPLYGSAFIDDSGYTLSTAYTGEVADRGSIQDIRQANVTRVDRGIQAIRDEIAERSLDPPRSLYDAADLCQRQIWIGVLLMSRGDFAEAVPWLEKARENAAQPGMPPEPRANIEAILGTAALRRGELENCVACLGPSSCILPIDAAARHQFPQGSRAALGHYLAYLKVRPQDLGVRWDLNIAAMTLGEYPAAVPEEFRIDGLDRPLSGLDVGRFVNVAQASGLGVRGANMAGGCVFDDFNGDDRPDLFLCSFDPDLGAAMFVNRGDGTFDDQSDAWGTRSFTLALNCAAGDYDNDGDLDVALVRGGWENPAPLTLLRNEGGRFEDVTESAGMTEPIASQSATWGDYDNDGDLDLFVCGEFLRETRDRALFSDPKALRLDDPRNHCRLYRNDGGAFTDVAESAGVINQRYAKGASWGDFDDDGAIDLYVSNMGGPNRLYHNQGDGTFLDIAAEAGVDQPTNSFACWWWDYDNDGKLDLYVCGYQAYLTDFVADRLGRPRRAGVELPRLYRNRGDGRFDDRTASAGLDRVYLPMGANFGDIDNDGYLDVYLSTGRPSYSFLVPNVLLKNVAGERFEDVSVQSGTAHLQKGHGVAFADYDGDGDEDLFAELGGAVPGDRAHNALFRNPGHGRAWLGLKLEGVRANRGAIGARVAVIVEEADGSTRAVHRVVGGNSSYGGNSRTLIVGLGTARRVRRVEITWPGGRRRQVVEGPSTLQVHHVREDAAPDSASIPEAL